MRRKFIGSNRTASDAGSKGSNARSTAPDRGKRSHPFFAMCIERGEYKASLQLGMAYKVIRPEANDPAYFFRVVDEEGEDYLYPADWFVPLDLPPRAKKALVAAGA
ncbi:MAG: hypothetical protein ABSD28_01175 [Tepidisphaeraceae bacterium]